MKARPSNTYRASRRNLWREGYITHTNNKAQFPWTQFHISNIQLKIRKKSESKTPGSAGIQAPKPVRKDNLL
jgi:hypothetical protein